MALTNPLKATTALRASFHRPGASRLAPYGRRVRVGGRLTTASGRPMPGMPVRVVERFAPGASPATRTSIVRTGPGGAFSLRTSSGPSRLVTELCRYPHSLAPSRWTDAGAGSADRVRLRVLGAGQDRRGAAGLSRQPARRPAQARRRARRWSSSSACRGFPGPSSEPSRRPPRPLPLRLPLQRRRQPRRPLPIPRLRAHAKGLAVRAEWLTTSPGTRVLSL